MAPQDSFIEEEEDVWYVAFSCCISLSRSLGPSSRLDGLSKLTLLPALFASRTSTCQTATFGHVHVDTRCVHLSSFQPGSLDSSKGG